MVVRTNKQTDEKFYGCTFYPHCSGTRKIEEEDTTEDMPSDKYRRADRDRWR